MSATKQHSGVAAIVLAAGMSSRMGTAKQLLRLGDRTMLESVLDNLRDSRVDQIVVVLGFFAERIQREVQLGDVSVVVNEAYRDGMGTSLRAGLSGLDPQTKGVLVVLADQPFVKPATMDHLIAQYTEHRPQIAIPVYRGFRGNPVLVDHSVFPELRQLTGDVGCRAIFGSHTENILKVPVDDPGILLDADTAADFEKFQQAHAQGEWDSSLLEHADLDGRKVSGPSLVVVGQDDVAQALVKLGVFLNFDVAVVDPFLTTKDFPGAGHVRHELDFSQPMAAGTYVVVASRGRFDEDAIEQALCAGCAYVALIANKKRAQEILNSLRKKGFSQEKLAGLRAPAGLDIGAESPEEIALSVLAEIVAEKKRSKVRLDPPYRKE